MKKPNVFNQIPRKPGGPTGPLGPAKPARPGAPGPPICFFKKKIEIFVYINETHKNAFLVLYS